MKTKIIDKISTPILVFLALIIFGVTNIIAAPGDLDPTFGQGGRVLTNIPVTGEPPGYLFYPNTESMLVQPDGKILVCGRFWQGTIEYWYGTMMVRYMPDGTIDTSFGENGKVAFIGPGFPWGNKGVGADMALQPDGKIVLIGNALNYEGVIVQRYTSAGVLDTTFGNNGITFVSGIAAEEGTSIALQPDGKIVGVGWDYDPDVTPYYDAILVFRLNTNGSLDNSFGSAGTGVVLIDDGYYGAEVLVQPDGKILVVGNLVNFSDVPPTILLARYNTDGTLDPSFGTGGMVRHRINNMNSHISAAALQPDGKIVVTGSYLLSGSGWPQIVVRYNANGSLDTSFGTNGVISVGADFFIVNYENTVLFQADGKIIVTGNAYDNATGHNGFAIVRLNSNGSIDPGFGVAGRSVFPINVGGTNYADASAGAIQPDGKILVSGYFGNYYTGSHEKIALIRVDGGQPSCPNPIDCNDFFVRQQYSDFLNREPDDGGLAYWTNEITRCGSDARCIHARRIGISGAFFVEPEFQETGYFVDRLYQASFGHHPTFAQFNADRALLTIGPNLEASKQALTANWVERTAFKDAYSGTMSPEEFVNKLFDTANLRPYDTERQQIATDMRNGKSRAQVLREVIEIAEFKTRRYNPAFVLMQYFGYLRRDVDQGGYDFWLDVLNNREPNNYPGMICSFITSREYQERFGPVVTRSNADCGQ